MPEPPPPALTYNGRRFRGSGTTATDGVPGDVGAATTFEYHQAGTVVWATYAGGSVSKGTLVAMAGAGGVLDVRYAHVAADGALRTGVCRTVPETLPDGRLRLHETWRWTGGAEGSGTSTAEEVPDIDL